VILNKVLQNYFEQIIRGWVGTGRALSKSFGDNPADPKPSLWALFRKRLQQEICGTDDSLIQDAKKSPGNATLITGMITAIVNLSGFPLPIDSAIATALAQPTGTGIALYLRPISIDVFCEWSEPQSSQP
jgi:hypothetical protein